MDIEERIRIDGRKELTRKEEREIRKQGGSTPVFDITFICHSDPEIIGTTSEITKNKLNYNYRKMNGSNNGKDVYERK